jgi:hygromycin-B 7''-O-kinase
MLPAVRTDEEWEAVVFDEKIVRPAVEDLATRLGLPDAELRRYPEGSRPVYAVGDRRVLKLYPTVSAPDSEVGEMLAALHGLDPEPLCGILGPADWAAFLTGQRATAVERQHEVRLPDLWLSQIEGFLESVPLTPRRERVLLHTELIREHLVVNPGTWTLSGMLDFETALIGDRAYEFGAVGLFVSRGDPRLLGRIRAAYGRSFDPRELLAHTLLHLHSNLTECLSDLLAPPEPTLDSLALTWFGTAYAAHPAALYGAAMAYDAAAGNVVLFGGTALVGTKVETFHDTWTWG